MPSASLASYLAFLPQHTPGQHHVLAVLDHGGGAELCAVASFAAAPPATMLADALNGVLSRQVTAEQRLVEDVGAGFLLPFRQVVPVGDESDPQHGAAGEDRIGPAGLAT